ncbi:hypothetical protein PRZ48_008277 [Zasmidium cellare]|uniref:Chromo domain-containing protein n=1 Tax=Zasmidium cellare TaxID=395010 RepID=A0ABR0EFT0_ZASCE|nr:hypothetical protein PRZ48_008277 [Zasmidium cellare]
MYRRMSARPVLSIAELECHPTIGDPYKRPTHKPLEVRVDEDAPPPVIQAIRYRRSHRVGRNAREVLEYLERWQGTGPKDDEWVRTESVMAKPSTDEENGSPGSRSPSEEPADGEHAAGSEVRATPDRREMARDEVTNANLTDDNTTKNTNKSKGTDPDLTDNKSPKKKQKRKAPEAPHGTDGQKVKHKP